MHTTYATPCSLCTARPHDLIAPRELCEACVIAAIPSRYSQLDVLSSGKHKHFAEARLTCRRFSRAPRSAHRLCALIMLLIWSLHLLMVTLYAHLAALSALWLRSLRNADINPMKQAHSQLQSANVQAHSANTANATRSASVSQQLQYAICTLHWINVLTMNVCFAWVGAQSSYA
jgi:hypothetical protein